ncbi:hypothetical protein V6N12_061421 [Hibiscus sabdariffa]|uniref:Uncharacterized protein n=1 Tax=Hibiscus sabdariffa TaxID=183260 RepID=A0ABR2E0C7_9ROSI
MAPVQSSSKAKLVLIFLAITALMSSSVPAAAAFTPQDFILKHLNLGRRFLQSYYNPPGGYGPPGAGGGYPCSIMVLMSSSSAMAAVIPRDFILKPLNLGRRVLARYYYSPPSAYPGPNGGGGFPCSAVVVLERASSIQNIELCCPLPSRAKEWEQ